MTAPLSPGNHTFIFYVCDSLLLITYSLSYCDFVHTIRKGVVCAPSLFFFPFNYCHFLLFTVTFFFFLFGAPDTWKLGVLNWFSFLPLSSFSFGLNFAWILSFNFSVDFFFCDVFKSQELFIWDTSLCSVPSSCLSAVVLSCVLVTSFVRRSVALHRSHRWGPLRSCWGGHRLFS